MVSALALWSGMVPLVVAWLLNRRTTLRPALLWAAPAWAVWSAVASRAVLGWGLDRPLGPYLGLSLISCAGMAVLGARRPGVRAWNFVVAGLLAVLLLPLVEGLGQLRLQTAHLVFLAFTLALPVLNYLPTRFGLAALLLGSGCAVEMMRLAGVSLPAWTERAGELALAGSSWLALLLGLWPAPTRTEFDRTWLAFRDRFGLVWGQRVREQFNRAAANAGWDVVLCWGRLERSDQEAGPSPRSGSPDSLLTTLEAILKRFGPAPPAGQTQPDEPESPP